MECPSLGGGDAAAEKSQEGAHSLGRKAQARQPPRGRHELPRRRYLGTGEGQPRAAAVSEPLDAGIATTTCGSQQRGKARNKVRDVLFARPKIARSLRLGYHAHGGGGSSGGGEEEVGEGGRAGPGTSRQVTGYKGYI